MTKIPKIKFEGFPDKWDVKPLSKIVSMSLRPVEKPNKPYWRLGLRSHYKGTFHELIKNPEDINMDTLYQVRDKDLIVNITFAWEHAIAIADSKDEGKLVSHRFPTYEFNHNLALPEFYRQYLKHPLIKYKLSNASPGGAGRNRVLNKKEFLKIEVPVPSINEQQKIASFLSLLDKKVEKQTKKIEQLEVFKKGMLQKLFSQEIRFKDDIGKEFPKWEEFYLDEIGSFKNGINKDSSDFGHGTPFVNLMDVFGKTYLFNIDFGLVKANDKELRESNLQKGDVLFIRSSVKPIGVGQTCVIMEDLPLTTYSGFLIRFREYSNKPMDNNYKKYVFYNPTFRKQLLAKSTISANTNINQESLKKLKIKVPTLREQQKIGGFLTAIDSKIEKNNKKLKSLIELKKGLLQQMFL